MRLLVAWLAATMLIATATTAVAKPGGSTHNPQTRSFSFTFSTGHGRLGAQVMRLTSQLRTYFGVAPGEGVLISEVDTGSVAHGAGLRAGDVIVEIAGQPIARARDIHRALARRQAGDKVRVVIVRNKKRAVKTVTLGAGRKPPTKPHTRQWKFNFDPDMLDRWLGPTPTPPQPGTKPAPNKQPRTSPKRPQRKLDDTRRRMRELEKRLRRLERRGPLGGGNTA